MGLLIALYIMGIVAQFLIGFSMCFFHTLDDKWDREVHKKGEKLVMTCLIRPYNVWKIVSKKVD